MSEEYEDDFEEDVDDELPPNAPVSSSTNGAGTNDATNTTADFNAAGTTHGTSIANAADTNDGRRPPWCLIKLEELELGEMLAQGAMGAVHAGVWCGQSVAVKTLHDTSSNALGAVEEELMVHAALSHPQVVKLHGANLTPPSCCIVMERCRFSLFERIHRQRDDLDRRHIVGMAIQVAKALEFLHSRCPPIVHRDIKSHNVLIDDNGDCKICDFGLVNSREVTAGTPNYMAPELFASKPYSLSVDVYALAVLLNEMFAREVPWDGYQPFDIKERVLNGERPPVARTMPRAGEGLLRKAWHQTASIRPAASQVVSTLRMIEESLPVTRIGLPVIDSLDEFASLRLNKTV